jgi:hypothetical protein
MCWGADLVEQADEAKDIASIRQGLAKAKMMDGSITASFQRQGKGKIAYRIRQHTYKEARYVNAFMYSTL